MLIVIFRRIGLLAKVWCSHHREFRENKYATGSFNHQALLNPNDNDEILNTIIKYNIKTYFPTRFVIYNEHKHKQSSWIINGIIRSITFRANLYRTLKQTSPNSNQFPLLKINLRTYNKNTQKKHYISQINLLSAFLSKTQK